MTLAFFSPVKKERTDTERYYISQFDSDTYQIIDSVENREVCLCSNYDEWEDAEERAKSIAKLLNGSNANPPG
jgi:hypothetical protein